MGTLDIRELPNGDLELSLGDVSPDEIRELLDNHTGDVQVLLELTESHWTNGGYTPFSGGDGNPFVGLTDAPCIAGFLDCEDDGTKLIVGGLWWFPNYAVESVVETLAKSGRVVFTAAPG